MSSYIQDPATFEIVKNSLYKIAEEMRVVLAKTAYSPILAFPPHSEDKSGK